jgi:hypothetical protein
MAVEIYNNVDSKGAKGSIFPRKPRSEMVVDVSMCAM